MKPKISVIVCVYNGKKHIKNCLDSILKQDFVNFEVLCVDGGSTDNSRKLIESYAKRDKRVNLLINKKRLPEGKGKGKWLGFKRSKGEIIGIIDQDNVLQNKEVFRKVIDIMAKNEKTVGILGGMKHNKSDHAIVRYVSLFGTDSFFAYRSADFLVNFLDKGRELKVMPMKLDNMIFTGGNCFFYKRKDLEEVGGYDQDVLVIQRLIGKNKRELIILSDTTKHYAEENLFKLAKKKIKWGTTYFIDQEEKFNYFPATVLERKTFIKNIMFNLSFLPNFIYSMEVYKKKEDKIAFLFPLMAFLNTLSYAANFLTSKLRRVI